MIKKATTVKLAIQSTFPSRFARPIPFKKIISEALSDEGIQGGSLAVVFVSDEDVRGMNRSFLKKDRATDVLAFDYALRPRKGYVFGDVFVSLDTAKRVAKQLRVPFEEEALRYVVHGVLHLLGYDDITPAKKKRMWKRQEEYVEKYMVAKSQVTRHK